MQLRYRYRLYPDDVQRRALAQAFGNPRVVYNDAVRARRDAGRAGEKFPSGTVLPRTLITDAKRSEERGWLAECSNIVLQQAIRDCDTAYKNFFSSLKGKRAGRRVGAPRFKSKRDRRQTIRLHTGGFSIRDNGKLRLARIGDVKVAWSRDLPSPPSSVTVAKTADERYFVSFVVEVGDETLPAATDEHGQDIEVGLDFGLSAFAVDQHGRVSTIRGSCGAPNASSRRHSGPIANEQVKTQQAPMAAGTLRLALTDRDPRITESGTAGLRYKWIDPRLPTTR